MYLIQRDDGKYVSMPGSYESYTQHFARAMVYSTSDEARANCCHGNEVIVKILPTAYPELRKAL